MSFTIVLRRIYLIGIIFLAHLLLGSVSKILPRISYQRILSEWKDIVNDNLTLEFPFTNLPSECGVRLSPLRSNLLEWHFTFTGMQDSPFDGGVYHGKIKLHPEYPQKAPSISVMTQSGRWQVNTEICLSASNYHQETWDPNWNLRTLALSLRSFMLTKGREIGGLDIPRSRQERLAVLSRGFVCPTCKVSHDRLVHEIQPALMGGEDNAADKGKVTRRSMFSDGIGGVLLAHSSLPPLPTLARSKMKAAGKKSNAQKGLVGGSMGIEKRRGKQQESVLSRGGMLFFKCITCVLIFCLSFEFFSQIFSRR